MYGDKCCYIHPSIPCKFGFYCTRVNCAYTHPPGFNPGMGMYPNMMQPIPFMKHKSKHTSGSITQEKNVEVYLILLTHPAFPNKYYTHQFLLHYYINKLIYIFISIFSILVLKLSNFC